MRESSPAIDLRQLLTLTDGTGILQHSKFATPDPFHGYCTDDNARALIACSIYERLRSHLPGSGAAVLPEDYGEMTFLLQRYLAFLLHAFNDETGRFRNFLGYDRKWLEEIGSEDSHCRAIWALGVSFARAPDDSTRGLAEHLLHQAFPAVEKMRNIRPLAFALLGFDEYLAAAPGDERVSRARLASAERLLEIWRGNARDDWPWWEDVLTWGNAGPPHALLVSGAALGREEMLEAGLKALSWLLDVQTAEAGHFSIIGNDGWYVPGGERARFDQQPLEAHGMVHACLSAARVTGEKRWEGAVLRAFDWFLGRNDIGVALYDVQTGGCHDGLRRDGVNANQGAESTLAYLLSVLQLHERRLERASGAGAGD